MAKTIKYVRRRGNSYEYHRRVPQDVIRDPVAWQRGFDGQRIFRKSLGTTDEGQLLQAADSLRREYEHRLALARREVQGTASENNKQRLTVTNELLAEISEQFRELTRAPWIKAYLLAEQDEDHAVELDRMIYDREIFAEERKERLLKPGARTAIVREHTPIQLAEELIQNRQLDAPKGSEEASKVALAIRSGVKNGEEDIDRILAGELPTPTHRRAASKAVADGSTTLRESVALYLSDRNLRPKTKRDAEKSLQLFESVVGNKRLVDLNREDFANFIINLADTQIGGKSRGSIQRGIAPATVEKRLKFLRTAINHAIEKGIYEGANPAANFKINSWVKPQDKSIMPAKRGFRIDELNLLFKHPWFVGCKSSTNTHSKGDFRLSGVHYWAPVVALFTGCRASELGGLKISEVHLDGLHPHMDIKDNEFRPTKKGYARSIPILDALMEVGFADYVDRVKRSGEERLFPDWLPPKKSGVFDKDDAAWSHASQIRSFNRTVIHGSLGHLIPAGTRSEVTFHSFRGAFKAMLGLDRYKLSINVINEVVGHSKSGMDQRYVGIVPLEETYPAIRACTYVGLSLPQAPPID